MENFFQGNISRASCYMVVYEKKLYTKSLADSPCTPVAILVELDSQCVMVKGVLTLPCHSCHRWEIFGGRRSGVVAGVLPPVLYCESGCYDPVTGVYAVPVNSCVCIGFTLKNRLHNFMNRLHDSGPMPSRSVSAQIVFPVKS